MRQCAASINRASRKLAPQETSGNYFDANFAPRYADNCVDLDLSAAAK